MRMRRDDVMVPIIIIVMKPGLEADLDSFSLSH